MYEVTSATDIWIAFFVNEMLSKHLLYICGNE